MLVCVRVEVLTVAMTPVLDLTLLCSCVFMGSLASGAGIIPTLPSRKSPAFVILSPFYPEFKAPSSPTPGSFHFSRDPLHQTLSGLLLVFPEVSKLYHSDNAQHHFGTLKSSSELFSILTFLWYPPLDCGRGKDSVQNSEFSITFRGYQGLPEPASYSLRSQHFEGQWRP